MGVSAGFASNRGLVRQTNEDSFLVRKGLYVVCDGMGGARGGEVASQMACERMAAIDPGVRRQGRTPGRHRGRQRVASRPAAWRSPVSWEWGLP